MLEFPALPQSYPEVQEAAKRRLNFKEIYSGFGDEKAAEQASRCSQCGVPFCQIHCPVQNNIPDWLKLVAEGRLDEAYAVSSATNTFPEICGRICPQDRLCEGNCVIEKGFGAVTIGSIEKYITENAFEMGLVKPITVARETGMSVGIIGAGPAGLSAADWLRRKGHEVHVYDRYDRSGGLMMYGIPSFKLEKEVVERRNRLLQDGGIVFHLNCDIGRDVAMQQLQQKHQAILIATGVYKAREIEAPNASLEHIIPALSYLTASNRQGFGEALPRGLDAKDKEVVVIGGGDTAMDCVRTAVRQGAKKVTCLYRRDRANMPGSRREVKNAEEEGVHFQWLSAPRAFVGDRAVSEILVQPMRLMTEGSGRRDVAPVEGESYRMKADLVIKALGFEPEELPVLFGEPKLELTDWGTLKINPLTQETTVPGIFAAGDIARGASLVVWAIRDGREAGEAMDRFLVTSSSGLTRGSQEVPGDEGDPLVKPKDDGHKKASA